LGCAAYSGRTAQAGVCGRAVDGRLVHDQTKWQSTLGSTLGTFVRNHMPQIAAMNLFVIPTLGFNLLYVFVIFRLARRELIWINVTSHPGIE
jgi:hypothetical protein